MTHPHCLLATVESDCHMWNLIYLQLLLEEAGATVRNLGICTPVAEVEAAVRDGGADLVVVSTVNGHGLHGGRVLIEHLRGRGLRTPCVIGGKLTTSEADDDAARRDLLRAGYVEVFTGPTSVDRFREFLRTGRHLDPALSTRKAGLLCTSSS